MSNWIPSFSLIAQPLYVLLNSDQPDPVQRNPEGKQAVETLKKVLSKGPALGYPNCKFPFFFFIHENRGNVLGVLTQRHGDIDRPIGYYSQQLDSVAKGLPPCMKAPSALSMLCKQTEEIVMGCPLTIYVLHSVESLLNSHHTQHFSVSPLASYEVVLLSAPNITLTWCNTLTLQLCYFFTG